MRRMGQRLKTLQRGRIGKGGGGMNDFDYMVKVLGERAEEMAKDTEVQKEMVKIAKVNGKEAAEKWLYMLAIASLIQKR